MIIIPQLSDSYGRRHIFIFTMAITLISEVGLIFSHSMNLSALYMVLLGFAFPGKNIVGLNYLLEFTPLRLHTKFVTTKMVCECLILYLMSKGYEQVSRHWLWIQLLGIAGTSIALLASVFIIPESPKFLYIKKRFDESRKVLQYIAWFNQSHYFNNDDFLFDTEFEIKTKKLGLQN